MSSDPTLINAVVAWALAALPRVTAAAVVLMLGVWASGVLDRAVLGLMERRFGADPTLRGVLGSVVRYGVLIIAVIAALAQLGIETGSVLTLLAAAGLAVGLALQATLANIAAGIMLLWLRPFRVGDRISVGPVTGKVIEVGLFASELHTGDGLYQFVPNSELWNKRLVNLTRLPTRMVEVHVRIADALRAPQVREFVAGLATDPRILAEPAPRMVVVDLAADHVVLAVRAWTSSADHEDVHQSIADGLLGVVATRTAPAVAGASSQSPVNTQDGP